MYEATGIQFVANGHFPLLNISHNIMVGFKKHADEMDRFQENAVVSGNFTSRQSSVNQSSIAGGLFYDRKWNEKFSSVLQVYNTDYMLRAENANLVENQRFLQENRVSETGVKLSGLYKMKSNLQLLGRFLEFGMF